MCTLKAFHTAAYSNYNLNIKCTFGYMPPQSIFRYELELLTFFFKQDIYLITVYSLNLFLYDIEWKQSELGFFGFIENIDVCAKTAKKNNVRIRLFNKGT